MDNKEKDIYQIYNEIDNLLQSIKIEDSKEIINNKKVEKENTININDNIPEMPRVFFDNEKPVIYKEKTEEEKELIEKIKKEEEQKIEVKEEDKKTKNKKRKKKSKKKKTKKWVITFSILDVLALICLFLMYGPLSYFRNLWVTSAMTTMTHQYLAYVFFNQEQIDKIMSQNSIIEVQENTNKDEINFEEQEEIIEFASPEDEQVLTKDEGNDLYKVIKVEGDGYKGHLLVIYDPSKLHLAQITNLKYGKTIEKFVQEYGAVAGTNAGGFVYSEAKGYTPVGTVIIDGQIINSGDNSLFGGGIIGITNDNILVLTKGSAEEAINMGVRDAVSFGPFLIVNGVASQFTGNGGFGVAPRTAIGQRKDGIVLLLVIDGRRPGHSIGVDMVELTNIMLKYGAYNASNLDGGGSSTIVVNGETLSVAGGYGYQGDRYLHNAWLLMP